MPKGTRTIPSWWLAVSGACLVGVSATLGPVLMWSLEEEIQANFRHIEELNDEIQELWNESVSFDRRLANVGVLLSVASQAEGSIREFALDRASEDAAAILSNSFNFLEIDAESCFDGSPDNQDVVDLMEISGAKAETCKDWYDQLAGGEIEAFQSVATTRSGMLGVFRGFMAEKRTEIADRRGSVREASANLWRVQLFATSFSLIGLLFLLLKDIPIWKKAARRDG